MMSLSTAALIGFIFETLFYGVFLIVLGISISLQWSQYRQESLTFGNKLAFAFSLLLSLSITTHWWLNLWGIYDAFLRTPTPLARETSLASLGKTTAITKLTIYEIQTWIGDALLIYRLYHVAYRKWVVVVLPAFTCCSLLVCISYFLYYASRVDFNQPQVLPETLSSIRKWAIVTFSLTVAENIYCLALIASFILWAHRGVRHATPSRLQSVLRIFIESAGIWVFFISLTFIIYLFDQNACYIVLYLTNPILGISFCMMIIRLRLWENSMVGPGTTKRSYISNFNAATKEQGPFTAGFENAPNELAVFSQKRTVDDSIFDGTPSKV